MLLSGAHVNILIFLTITFFFSIIIVIATDHFYLYIFCVFADLGSRRKVEGIELIKGFSDKVLLLRLSRLVSITFLPSFLLCLCVQVLALGL